MQITIHLKQSAMPAREKYYYQRFEIATPTWAKAKRPPKKDWQVFLEHINFPIHALDEYEKLLPDRLLEDFGTHIMGNIYWYERKIIQEKGLRMTYIFISLGLLLLLPIAVASIQKYTESVSA